MQNIKTMEEIIQEAQDLVRKQEAARKLYSEPIRETYYITAQGVTVICHERDNVLEWVDFITTKGWVPTVEKRIIREVAA